MNESRKTKRAVQPKGYLRSRPRADWLDLGGDDRRDWEPANLSGQEVCLWIICVGVSARRQTTGRERHSAR